MHHLPGTDTDAFAYSNGGTICTYISTIEILLLLETYKDDIKV
jgi:hypothetical protein